MRKRVSIAASLLLALGLSNAGAQEDDGDGIATEQNKSVAAHRNGVNVALGAQRSGQQGTKAEQVGAGVGGTWEVSPDGSFQYTIPIEVPANRRSVQPDLAVAYDSMVANGLLGVGWTLTGLPAIVRAPHVEGVRFDASDTFVVNYSGWGTPASPRGRLVRIDPASPGDPVTYRPSEGSDELYQPIGDCGAGPCAWLVRMGDGLIMIFGATEEAQLWERDDGDGRPGVRAWALTHVSDPFGNSWGVSYDKDDAMLYPRRVDYTCQIDPSTVPWNDPPGDFPPPPPGTDEMPQPVPVGTVPGFPVGVDPNDYEGVASPASISARLGSTNPVSRNRRQP